MINRSGYGQLRWVILLLAVAVILPTVCLLWFMSQAIKNVKLAARQELIDSYQNQLEQVRERVDTVWSSQVKYIHIKLKEPIPDVAEHFVRSNAASADGVIIYNAEGNCIYPTRSLEEGDYAVFSELYEEAWRLEFAEKNAAKALKVYEEISAKATGAIHRKKLLLQQVRCLRKLGQLDKAKALCIDARETGHGDKGEKAYLRATAELILTELRKETDLKNKDKRWRYYDDLRNLLGTVSNYNTGSGTMLDIPSDQRVLLAKRALELVRNSDEYMHDESHKNNIESIRRIAAITKQMMAAEELALGVSELYPTMADFAEWRSETFRVLPKLNNVYCFYFMANDKTVLLLRKRNNIVHKADNTGNIVFDLWYYDTAFNKSRVAYRILDRNGTFVGGTEEPTSESFVKGSVSKYFPGWKIELFFEGVDVSKTAANRQITVYTWTAMLVIVLILVSGGIAGQAVGKQIKLNRLKNDFIATVSHELKTPLASMRVLADTLLEGNYKDQEQATEYLHLICKENKRLSGLIDNFLTFSRMERNKHAFDIVKTSPASIARAADDAVKTKFNKGRCEFKVKIGDDLPDVLADQDAMVTVLVNLLDNAYKYSCDEKHIELRVYSDDDSVSFGVSDNGIGLSQRAIKKIFKRFYQVDRSLSREAEGCGLGLSITKFIVDAHKGSIDIESKPGTGSTFTVKLPAAN
ncbi:MAG: sensor histidine kinase [Planctomycetota bacterium]|jgi:signal transduction histidine kinase